MNCKWVAQLFLLFKCERHSKELELAYVSWFETKRVPNSQGQSGPELFSVERTTKFTVIDVKAIIRGVHLISKFRAQIGETMKLKKSLDSKRGRWHILVNI